MALLPVAVVAGCKRSEVECQPRAYFRLVEPERKTGAAPFSIDRLGPEMKETVAFVPLYVTFKEGNHTVVSWLNYGDSGLDANFIYSPEEGLARNSGNADNVLVMKKLSADRLLMGFRSPVCTNPKSRGDYCMFADFSEEMVPVAVEMTCRRLWVWEDP